MKQNKDIPQQLEEVGSKTLQLLEKRYLENEPKAIKLLEAFSNWLDKKLQA